MSFHTKIAGVSHKNDDGSSRQKIIKSCQVGEELVLVRDPANEFDKNAVKVFRKNGHQLGYIPAHVVGSGLAREIDRGEPVTCTISALTGGDGLTRGVNVWIEQGEEIPGLEPSTAVTEVQRKGEFPFGVILTGAIIVIFVLTYVRC